jgi:Domain of unknown function (DUF5615)
VFELYFDENSGHSHRVGACRAAGHLVVTAAEAGMLGQSDPAHLDFAAAHNFVIVTEDVRDFAVLHKSFIAEGRSHAGILIVHQSDGIDPGEFVRCLLALDERLGGQPMSGRLEYLPRTRDSTQR